MDGVKAAWRGVVASHKFFFWALIAWATQAVYWFQEASREQLILRPRVPKDLYDNGYALFAFDINSDSWKGYWRRPDAQPGQLADENFYLLESQWDYVPAHDVEFSNMPHLTYPMRAVSLAWCRENVSTEPPMHLVKAA